MLKLKRKHKKTFTKVVQNFKLHEITFCVTYSKRSEIIEKNEHFSNLLVFLHNFY